MIFSSIDAIAYSTPKNAVTSSQIILVGNTAVDNYFSGQNTTGTQSDPYILENLVIDANGIGSAIQIRDTNRYIIIRNNTLTGAGEVGAAAGLELYNSSNVIIQDNTIFNNGYYGISLFNASSNQIVRNQIYKNNRDGIYIDFNCNGNHIYNNSIHNNTRYGINLRRNSNSNQIWLNIFKANLQANAMGDETGANTWDNGSKGNYWGDYPDRYPNATISSEIWSISYSILGTTNDVDRFPLVLPEHLATYTPPPIIYTKKILNTGEIVGIVIGLIFAIGGFIGVFVWKRIPIQEPLQTNQKPVKKSKILSKEELLFDFRALLQQVPQIKKKVLAEYLNVPLKALYDHMVDWNQTIPFSFKGEFVEVENWDDFYKAVSKQLEIYANQKKQRIPGDQPNEHLETPSDRRD
jgi:parallel beta-helix repeat protein